jgi:hypothetical protein
MTVGTVLDFYSTNHFVYGVSSDSLQSVCEHCEDHAGGLSVKKKRLGSRRMPYAATIEELNHHLVRFVGTQKWIAGWFNKIMDSA